MAARQSATRLPARQTSLATPATIADPRRRDELVALHEALPVATDAAASHFCRERLAWPPEQLNPPPLVDGGDLIRHGLKPGPQFSDLLEQVRDAQLNGEIHTRDEALASVDRLRRRPNTLP